MSPRGDSMLQTGGPEVFQQRNNRNSPMNMDLLIADQVLIHDGKENEINVQSLQAAQR